MSLVSDAREERKRDAAVQAQESTARVGEAQDNDNAGMTSDIEVYPTDACVAMVGPRSGTSVPAAGEGEHCGVRGQRGVFFAGPQRPYNSI